MDADLLPEPEWLYTQRAYNSRIFYVTHGARNGYTLCGIEVRSRKWESTTPGYSPTKCETCAAIPPGHATSGDLVNLGLTYRQVDHWVKRQWLRPGNPNPGYGKLRFFPLSEVRIAAAMARLVKAGVTPEAACHAVRNDGQLAPGVRVVVDAA